MAENLSNIELRVPDTHLKAGLYIHIPFCRRKCPYCDFYSVTETEPVADFLNALETEMRLYADRPLVFDTIYIGGGTPSVLSAEDILRILRAAGNAFQILPDSEITLEINPGTVTAEKLHRLRLAGINRISIGIQSFQQKNLQFLGRIHSSTQASATIQAARQTGFERIGLDLIYGLPNQTVEAWLADLAQAVAFVPEHVSCYALTYASGTPLSKDLAAGRLQAAGDETVAELFLKTSKFLQSCGYEHYEISNFARGIDSRSRHNCKYWTFAPFIGLGPSAHSFVEPQRWWNRADVQFYVEALKAKALPHEAQEALTPEQMMIEAVYLGLRQADGIGVKAFERRFQIDFREIFDTLLLRYEHQGLLQVTPERCSLTLRGMLLLDSIAAALVAKIPEN
jgi:oxygen-independent coproporphyrinogen-3 oxidase